MLRETIFNTAIIVAFFTLMGLIVQFVVNPLLNNYLAMQKEKESKKDITDNYAG